MIRACVLVGLLFACERRSTEQPPPAPHDAAIDAPVDALVDQARIEALDRLYTYVTTTKRTRSPTEADERLTNAYRDWMFAYGYARAGKPERARELGATAKSALASVMDDPVHRALGDAFAARVSIALAGKPSRTPLPASVESQIAMLDRGERYTVDRLRESSRILGVIENVDAISAFARRRKDDRGDEIESLKGVADVDARARILAKVVESVATAQDRDRARLLEAVLAEGLRMPPVHAKRLLGVAVAQVGLVPAPNRGRVYAAAIVLAHAADPAQLRELVGPAALSLTELEPWELANALESLVRTIGKTHRAELGTIWKQVEANALDPKSRAFGGMPRPRAAYAAGLVQLGDPRAPALLAKLEKDGDPQSLSYQLELVRTLVLAYAQLPRAEALAAIERLARQFPGVTDSFRTNSHYAKSVLDFVDMLVVGVVDE